MWVQNTPGLSRSLIINCLFILPSHFSASQYVGNQSCTNFISKSTFVKDMYKRTQKYLLSLILLFDHSVGVWGVNGCQERVGERGTQGHRGGGVRFDSLSQLAPSIQDALGQIGRGAEGARQRWREWVSIVRGRRNYRSLFSLHFTFRGEKKKWEVWKRGERKKMIWKEHERKKSPLNALRSSLFPLFSAISHLSQFNLKSTPISPKGLDSLFSCKYCLSFSCFILCFQCLSCGIMPVPDKESQSIACYVNAVMSEWPSFGLIL